MEQNITQTGSTPEHLKKIIEAPELEDIKSDLNSLAKNSKALASSVKTEGSELVRDGIGQLKSTGKSEYERLEAFVKEKPAQGVAIGFVSGLLLSMLLGGGRRH